MTLPALTEDEIAARLDRLVRQHEAAGGLAIRLITFAGGQAESAFQRLPREVQEMLGRATEQALERAVDLAQRSRVAVPDQSGRVNLMVTTGLGAAGGAGGLPTAVAELPVTVTMLLRSIQGVAAQHGFDPADAQTQKACLAVFSEAGPLARDDGAEVGFMAARVTLTGATVQSLIARVAPRLALVLGQKLAAQTVPVLGAAAGAATNYAYANYYEAMAQVSFGLRALERDSGRSYADLVSAFADRIEEKRLST